MDKNAIKKYAVWARRELIERVSQRAMIYGITAKDAGDPNAESVNGHLLSQTEKRQRQALIRNIKSKGYEQVMEEVAYTWFNRFAALRFMEVNGYLPSHIRVFTNDAGEFKPQILAEAIHLELDGLDMNKVYELESANKSEELFKYLLIVQCNALNSILPGMFQRIEDYTELLLPDYLLREGSVIDRLIKEIPEDNFDIRSEVGNGQVEIIGWLYQYYITEKHEDVVNPLHGKVVKKEEIPAATQLFTTDWVVRYLIDNSVGRYWIERNPNSILAEKLDYFVKPKRDDIRYIKETIAPQDLSIFDPCVGSGHFLVYAFDVLIQIYIEYGYSAREAAAEIVGKNLYGLDIDSRAVQLAYFAVMMKARQYDRRFFSRGIQPKIYEIIESNNADQASIEYFCGTDADLKKDIKSLLVSLKDAKEYGSILRIPNVNFKRINERFAQIDNEISIYKNYLLEELQALILPTEILSKKYAIVVTNPPYFNKYDDMLKKYIVDYYVDFKGDLFSVFMYHNFEFCKVNGYVGFMTPMVWMFIQTYEKLRRYVIEQKAITTLIQFEYSAYEEATVPICSFVLKNGKETTKGCYFRLSDFKGGMDVQRQKTLQALANRDCNYYFEAIESKFSHIPGSPIAYWVSDAFFKAFDAPLFYDFTVSDGQNKTGNNAKYVRYFWEIKSGDVGIDKKWLFYAKGGGYRKWVGNLIDVVDWSPKTREFYRKDKICRIIPEYLWYKKGITWGLITSYKPSFRILPEAATFDVGGSSVFFNDYAHFNYYLGLLNSKVYLSIAAVLNPTINFQVKDIRSMPIIMGHEKEVHELVKSAIYISAQDWNSFETSWDFLIHPLIQIAHDLSNNGCRQVRLSEAYSVWERTCEERFIKLKEIEEQINRIFIEVYGMQKDLEPEVEDKDITIRKADIQRDIKSLLSYAVGCMFGRYSVSVPGLIYAGGDWDSSQYPVFQPDKDAIIPICDDEYFEDDIVGHFIKFVEVIYGKETIEENLRFIADALGGTGPSREVIRSYFIYDFYTDHLKVYQKRPIYWLFDSGKKNSFKCLIYIHRYQPDTIARIRTDYVHGQQSRYRTAIADLEQRINGASTSERVKLSKQLTKLQAQAEEIRVYEEKIHHLADQMIKIDLDDGVKHNYAIFKDVLANIK